MASVLTRGYRLRQPVTGHKTTDIVLKHYFQPGREDFRRALQSAMPKLLTRPSPGASAVVKTMAGQAGAASQLAVKSPKDEMKEILDGLTAKNWKKGNARLLALLGKV